MSRRASTKESVGDNACVVVSDLVMTYGSRRAVDGISLSAERGEILALLGPNGAGKTSTIEAAEGYRAPTGGTIRVLGLDPRADAKALAPRIGVMLQRNGVYLTMGPLDTLKLFAAYYGDRAVDPKALLEQVGLAQVASTPWRRLSGGEQQRLSLALALVGQPEVVFLDEPTAMIDPAARTIVRELISGLRENDVCVVLTTHDLADAERLADTVVIVDEGRVVAQGTLRELTTATSSDGIDFTSTPGIDTAALAAELGGFVREHTGGAYSVSVQPTPGNVAALTSWLAQHHHSVGTVRAGQRSLEDVFIKLTESARQADQSAALPRRGRPGRRKDSRLS